MYYYYYYYYYMLSTGVDIMGARHSSKF